MSTNESFIEPRVSGGDIVKGEKILFKRLVKTVTLVSETCNNINLAKFRAFKYLEGTVYRIFFDDNKLYIATSRSVEHITSQKLFDQFGIKADSMNKDCMYIFLQSVSGRVTFLGISDEDGFTHANDIAIFQEVSRREELFFDNVREIGDFVFETDQEVILLNETDSIRIVSSDRNNIRGRASSLIHRYLELRSKRYEDLPIFFAIYPEMVPIAEEIEERLYSIAKYFHDIYMRIFIKNETTLKCTKDERTVLGMIHKLYTTTKQRTIPSRVNNVLASVHPSLLEKLLNYQHNKIIENGRNTSE